MIAWAACLAAIAVAVAAGAVVVVRLWPEGERLQVSAAAGLACLIGPAVVGVPLMAGGAIGAPARVTVGVTSLIVLAALGAGARRARRGLEWPRSRRSYLAHGVLVLAIAWTSGLALRTHLGWDGTVVWFHKARMLVHGGGWMAGSALRDTTRTWTAPDYPLHVPLAEAWLMLFLGEEDQRPLKLLPAAWCAGILCLVFGAVRDRPDEDAPPGDVEAAAAVLLLAAVPRLLIGEGSFGSGYADGPASGLLAALVWLAWRSGWGANRAWHPTLAVVAAGLVWTKQEGLAATVLVGFACATAGRGGWKRARFIGPAVVVGVAWQAWVRLQGGTATMAYAWPQDAGTWIARLLLIGQGYATEMLDVATWGLYWPALLAAALYASARGGARPVMLVLGIVGVGILALSFSAWPDLSEHVRVTAPRQLIQAVPALLMCCFALKDLRATPLVPKSGDFIR